METIVLWQSKWGTSFHIPLYLFLGGLAGGTLSVGALADLVGRDRPGFRQFASIAAYVTLPAIVVGGLALSFHLGKPERGFAFPLFFTNYQSWLTIGGAVVGAFAPLSVAYAAAWAFGFPRWIRTLMAAVAVPLGLIMSLYTGLLLSAAWLVPGDRWYVPLWDRNYLPVLFLLSGFSTGLAACGLVALLMARLRRVRRASDDAEGAAPVAEATSAIDALALVVEAAWVYVFLVALAGGTTGQQLAYYVITRGPLASWWWAFVATGLAAPLLVTVVHFVVERMYHTRLPWLLYAKFAMVLVGGLLLRYTIVWGGDLKSPLIFPPQLWPVPTAGVSSEPPAGLPTLPPVSGLGR
jgi:formate-dependent nitrite reductase membrane component NrfD